GDKRSYEKASVLLCVIDVDVVFHCGSPTSAAAAATLDVLVRISREPWERRGIPESGEDRGSTSARQVDGGRGRNGVGRRSTDVARAGACYSHDLVHGGGLCRAGKSRHGIARTDRQDE